MALFYMHSRVWQVVLRLYLDLLIDGGLACSRAVVAIRVFPDQEMRTSIHDGDSDRIRY